MATIPTSLLLALSSPYAKRGEAWKVFSTYHGKAGTPVLTWHGKSREMNPKISALTVATAYLRDAASARSEFDALFRDDLESFLSREIVEACIGERFELPPVSGVRYFSFTDASGGRSDSFALAIGHFENERAVLDCIREKQAPFSLEAVCQEYAELLRQFHLSTTVGDRYSGEWVVEGFRKHAVEYKHATLNRSELYLELLPHLVSGKIVLLKNSRLVNQLCGLERRVSRIGRDIIDHAPGNHDDLANVCAGVVAEIFRAHGTGAQLGLVAFLKNLARKGPDYFEAMFPEPKPVTPRDDLRAKHEALALEAKILGIQPVQPNTFAEPRSPCPRCGAMCTTRIGGCGLHCNQCAFSDCNVVIVQRPPSRSEILRRMRC